MEVNAVNTTPVDVRALETTDNVEEQTPSTNEATETPREETREAYTVQLSEEATRKAEQTNTTTETEEPSQTEQQTPETVQAYNNTGRIAG